MRDAYWIFAVAVAWLLGVAWERIATRFWEARANLWYNIAIGHEGEIDRLRYQLDPAKAGAWLELMGSGANLDVKHPIHLLRERLLNNKMSKAKISPLEVAALSIKSWNHFVTGKRTSFLVWKTVEGFPTFAKP